MPAGRFRRIQVSDLEPPARHWCRECANEESANDRRPGHGRIDFEVSLSTRCDLSARAPDKLMRHFDVACNSIEEHTK